MIQVIDHAPVGVVFKPRQEPLPLPMASIEIGQCFFVHENDRPRASVRVAAFRHSRDGKKFVTAKTDDGIWVKRIS